MSRIDALLRLTDIDIDIDITHIEKYADEDFRQSLRQYTELVVSDVIGAINNTALTIIEERGRTEILHNLQLIYGISKE